MEKDGDAAPAIISIFGDAQHSIARWYVDSGDGTPAQEVQRSQVDGEECFECTCEGNYARDWCSHVELVCAFLAAEEAVQQAVRAGLLRPTGLFNRNGHEIYEVIPEAELTDLARAERRRLGWSEPDPKNYLN